MVTDIEARVRGFIEDNFFFADDIAGFASDASLLEAGVIDSTGVLELVAYIEGEFGIRVNDSDIVPENLDSIGAITAFIVSRQMAQPQVA